ncbi:hypothetical protein B0T16DRAFT_458660 [Cercophora newfieldiana]|uniref:BTB domain-containing protein n=1 Tax=Cercophora newfieldiana TaxID=92897 RepID=A0AA40CPQ5_9PEZI|nr:hypothetical protein B0T16DRAFT_458660 [Cercophora newfieldiana]
MTSGKTDTLSFREVVASKVFTFTVEVKKRKFTIHSALVANWSRFMDRLVNGGFKEAAESHATLESDKENPSPCLLTLVCLQQQTPEANDVANSSANAIAADSGPGPMMLGSEKDAAIQKLWAIFEETCATQQTPTICPRRGTAAPAINILLRHAEV